MPVSARTPWIVTAIAGAGLLVLLLVVLVRGQAKALPGGGAAPFAASSGQGTPPDISNMSPRERFDRLYNRVMAAAESGDEATVKRFSPMAVLAYGQLDSVDADARFHLALLKLHTGDAASVSALADTILQNSPGHLFGYIIRGTAARFNKDDSALRKAYADFLAHYDAEMKAGRPEYLEHKRSVDDFHQAAVGKGPEV